MLPKPLKRKLESLRRRVRLLLMTRGSARLLLMICAWLVLLFVLDRGLELPRTFRAVLLALFAGSVAAVAGFGLLRWLFARFSDERLALLYERSFPGLKSSLISSVQFARQQDQGWCFNSRELMDEVIGDTTSASHVLDPSRVVRFGAVLPLLGLALFSGLGTSVFFYSQASIVDLWARRVFLLEDELYPRRTALEVVGPRANPHLVARGDQVLFEVDMVRGNPETTEVVLIQEYEGLDAAPRRHVMRREGRRYTVEIDVLKPFKYRFEGDDAVTGSRWVRLGVQPRVLLPLVAQEFEYPAYTGEEYQPGPDETSHEVPVGTVYRVAFRTNKPIASARAVLNKSSELDIPAADITPAEEGGSLIRWQFEVNTPKRYRLQFQLESEDGFQSLDPKVFSLRGLPDTLPFLQVLKPDQTPLQLTNKAKVAFAFEADDDYGLRTLMLEAQIRLRGSDVEEAELPRVALWPKDEAREFAFDEAREPIRESFQLALEGFVGNLPDDVPALKALKEARPEGLIKGDQLRYRLVATDHGGELANRRQVTPWGTLQIIDLETLREKQRSDLRQVIDKLKSAHKSQEQLSEDMSALVTAIGSQETFDEDDIAELSRIHYAQREKVGRNLLDASQTLIAVLGEMEANGLAATDEAGWLKDIQKEVAAIIAHGSDALVDGIGRILQKRDVEHTQVANVPLTMAEVADQILAVIAKLEKWNELTELIKEFEQLIDIQGKILEELFPHAEKALEGGDDF